MTLSIHEENRPAQGGQTVKLLKIWNDEVAEDPRSCDNLGTMVCWHRRYCLGDPHSFATPQDFLKWTKEADLAVMLPLYLYDHSGLTISTCGDIYPFNDPWDAGQVGWIYITKSRLQQEYCVKKVTRSICEKAREALLTEVKTYDQYLRGEVYGFSVYTIVDNQVTSDDSCGGFYGDDPTKNGMLDYVPEELAAPLQQVHILHDGLVVTNHGNVFRSGSELRHFLEQSGVLQKDLLVVFDVFRDLAVV